MSRIPAVITILINMVWEQVPCKVCIVSDNTGFGAGKRIPRITTTGCVDSGEIILPGPYITCVTEIIRLVKHLGECEVGFNTESFSPFNIQLSDFGMDMIRVFRGERLFQLLRRD